MAGRTQRLANCSVLSWPSQRLSMRSCSGLEHSARSMPASGCSMLCAWSREPAISPLGSDNVSSPRRHKEWRTWTVVSLGTHGVEVVLTGDSSSREGESTIEGVLQEEKHEAWQPFARVVREPCGLHGTHVQ